MVGAFVPAIVATAWMADAGAPRSGVQGTIVAAHYRAMRILAGGQADTYTVTLLPGQVLTGVAAERGIDLMVDTFDPAGAHLGHFDQYGGHETGADTDNFVTQVRVTSPAFHTADGLHIGSPYAQHAGRFPIKDSVKTRPGWRLIDERRDGIAIEVANGRCAAIVVHPRGEGVLQTYSPYPGYDLGA